MWTPFLTCGWFTQHHEAIQYVLETQRILLCLLESKAKTFFKNLSDMKVNRDTIKQLGGGEGILSGQLVSFHGDLPPFSHQSCAVNIRLLIFNIPTAPHVTPK